METKPEVLEALNVVLVDEMYAFNQYLLHSQICEDWDLPELGKKFEEKSTDSLNHAKELMQLILMYGGITHIGKASKLPIVTTLTQMFEMNLEAELQTIKDVKSGIELCQYYTAFHVRGFLEKQIAEEEWHAHWCETQLELIEKVGEKAYIAEYLRGGQ